MKDFSFAISAKPHGKVLRIVTAACHPIAAADFWNIDADAVTRMSGWAGGDGSFAAIGHGEVFVRRTNG